MYKCINYLAPAYLCSLFAPRTPNYYFCNAKKKIMLPKSKTDYLKRSFSYNGALLWNNLPEEIRTSNSIGLFKRSSHRFMVFWSVLSQVCKAVLRILINFVCLTMFLTVYKSSYHSFKRDGLQLWFLKSC